MVEKNSEGATPHQSEHEDYADVADIMQTLGHELARERPGIEAGDRLRLAIPMPPDASGVIDSYWMYMVRGGGHVMDSRLHRNLLRSGTGLIRAEIVRGPAKLSYNLARPNSLAPGQAVQHFAVFADCSVTDVAKAVRDLSEANDHEPVTPEALCRSLGAAGLVDELDTPRAFIIEGMNMTVLRQTSEHEAHMQNLRELAEAVSVSDFEG